MRKVLAFLLRKPLIWMADLLTKAPRRDEVLRSLGLLYYSQKNLLLKRLQVVEMDAASAKIIVFSDQHKGNRSWADDFSTCETNYLAALDYYHRQGFTLVNLGDSEELWKFPVNEVLKHNQKSMEAEAAFYPAHYFKTFGNHDMLWKSPIDVALNLSHLYDAKFMVYEGLLIKMKGMYRPFEVFLTHGHQGDRISDSNAVASWFIAKIWMPLQRYLRININTPSTDYTLRNRHNQLMYEWSRRKKSTLLITGHTHKPVFASGKYSNKGAQIESPDTRSQMMPTYYNTGCCCFADGDITGIEIENGCIRLIKWWHEEVKPERQILEEAKLEDILRDMEDCCK